MKEPPNHLFPIITTITSIPWTDLIITFILYLPFGFIIGAMTQRLSYKNRVKYIFDDRTWNTSIKFLCAFSVLYFILASSCFTKETCSSNFFSRWGLDCSREEDGASSCCCFVGGSSSIQMERILVFVIRIIVVSLGTMFGTALQGVALTGGIACGKSTVSKLLTEANNNNNTFTIIDLDTIGHDILDPIKMKSDSAYYKLLREFGNDILTSNDDDGTADRTKNSKATPPPSIDRKKLGDIVFSDKQKRKRLNAITHPLILKVMLKQMIYQRFFSKNNVIAIVDIPLFYETGTIMRILFGLVMVAACAPSNQLERMKRRNSDWSIQHCQERIQSQIPIEKKVQLGDVIIWNDESLEKLKANVAKARMMVESKVVGWGGVRLSFLVVCIGVFWLVLWGLLIFLGV